MRTTHISVGDVVLTEYVRMTLPSFNVRTYENFAGAGEGSLGNC